MNKRAVGLGLVLTLSLSCSFVLFFEVSSLILLSDDFEGLSNWTAVNGVWTVSNGILEGTTSADAEGLVWTGDSSWMNYQVTANMRILSSGGEASLAVRYIDSSNFYWLGLGCFEHKYSIAKAMDGVYTELSSSGLASEVEVGRWYTVTAVAVCGTLGLFVDGVKVLEVQDTSHPNGAVGFRTWDGTMEVGQMIVQSLGWSQTYGETSSDFAYSVVQTSDGGYALAGSTSSYGSGDYDFWLVKTDYAGNQQWTKTYGGISSDVAYSVVQTSDGGYALSNTQPSWLLTIQSSSSKHGFRDGI